ncbi:MAG: phage terminase large subunit family protein [Spirochaetaceae bacterium]|nr:phage terminase large subunit family protein [Spirochaetaceae bacterium]
MPGPFRWDVTPYWKEVLDCLGPTSPVREIYILKGAQIGYTVAVLENMLGYIIDSEPGPSLYLTGDKGMAEATMNLRVDRMIQSAGIQHKIFAQVQKKSGKKTGDTNTIKEFPGGFLKAIGPNSGAKLRSDAIRYLLGDELDAMPLEVGGQSREAITAQEGDPWTLAVRRTDSYEAIRKILGGSTPLIKQTSRIAALHAEGDARRYFVPCRHCGEMQPLEWKQIKYEKDPEGRLLWPSVRYECAACGKPWRNADKAYFLPRGEWRATQEPRRPNVRSYSLSSLYSPVGMRSWEDICEEWIKAQGHPSKLRTFVNTVLGEPYEERGEAPDFQRIMLRRESYSPESLRVGADGALEWIEAILPPAARVLTLGADVQHDRIELELVAWGRDMESWSAGYYELAGDTSDLSSYPWHMLRQILARKHGGLTLSLALIDSGDQAPIVYSFCDEYQSAVLPSKGGYRATGGRNVFALRSVAGHQCSRIDLDESYLKEEFYALARRGPADRPQDGETLPAGYCHFPADYDRRHFEKLFAEDKIIELDRFGRPRPIWKRRGRNEALDARAYALGALYVVASAATAPDDDKAGSVDWPLFWELAESS